MRSWKNEEGTAEMGRPRLTVDAATKRRIHSLMPRLGTSEKQVVCRLLELAETASAILSPDRDGGPLDTLHGAPRIMQG